MVRDGNGGKDRVTVLPLMVVAPLRAHLGSVLERHRVAVREGYGGVELPPAVARKYPAATMEWSWQYVFPALGPSRDPRTGARRRHHVMEDSVQRQMRAAVRRSGIGKPATCHTLRHCFATHLLERVSTTQIYTHVLGKGANAVASPADD
jgi:integrase